MNAIAPSKAELRTLVDDLPEPVDVEELIYRLCVREKLAKGAAYTAISLFTITHLARLLRRASGPVLLARTAATQAPVDA